MKRTSRSLYILKGVLWRRYRESRDPKQKDDFLFMHDLAQDTEKEYDRMFGNIEMQMIRNPAFPDDMVGYPDDDIKLFDEIEEEKRKKRDDNQE
jgi:hypothetical protein